MRKPIVRLSCALIAAAGIIPITATGTETYGTVLDPDGLPVSGARVAVGGLTAWSSADGGYRLSDVPAGAQAVAAHFRDFEAIELQVTIPPSGSVRVDIHFRQVRESFTAVVVVADTAEALAEIPGSVAAIQHEELNLSKPVEANEVLRRVPGLVVRADSGPVSMRLNIGVRGLNPDRSRNVLMLEDGIPIALAPYGEPEMYYSPPIDRMRRVEVLKGAARSFMVLRPLGA